MQEPVFLKDWLIAVEKEPAWIIPQLIPADSFLLVSGPQKKAKKTWFTTTVALAAAMQKRVGGIFEAAATPQKVLIIQEEGGKFFTKGRIRAVATSLGIPPDSIENVWIHHRARIKMDDPESVGKLVAQVEQLKPDLIIADPLINLMSGDEDKAVDVNKIITTLQKLRGNGATIILIVHTRKPPRPGYNRSFDGELLAQDPDDEVRGSTAIAGVYDRHFAFRPCPDNVGPLSLTVVSRDFETERYSVDWDIQTFPGEKLVRSAALTLKRNLSEI